VLIVTEDANGKPLTQGTGFFVSPDVVATNFHVIKGATRIYVRIVGQAKEYNTTTVIDVDRDTDLALVKVSGIKARALPLGISRRIAAGDTAYALGNPKGFEGTISSGLVSGVRRDGNVRLLQFDAAISPGSSGGPVLDDRGEVIGVASLFFRESQNLNFAVHVSHLADLLNREKNGRPTVNGNSARERSIPPVGNRKSTPVSPTIATAIGVTAVPQPREAAPPPRPDPKATHNELLPLLRQTIRARVEGDSSAMSALLADDFTMLIDRYRKLDKGAYLAELTGARDVMLYVLERAELGFDSMNNPVMTSVVRYRSLRSQNARFENIFTYVKRQGNWQIASWRSRQLSRFDEVAVDHSLASTDTLLLEARTDLRNGKYDSVIINVMGVLEAEPDNAEANLLLGKSYFAAGKYKESVPYLARAATLGQRLEFPLYHHRRTSLGLDDDLISGELIIEKGSLQYQSKSATTVNGQSVSEPNFTVPFAKISEVKYEENKGRRLHMEVVIPKGNKEERKGFNFYPTEARTRKQYSPEKFVLDCSGCSTAMETIHQILIKLTGK
jgi:tetratricopeptide (TPR) repeat protein